jgi:hypothetical protein
MESVRFADGATSAPPEESEEPRRHLGADVLMEGRSGG